MDLTELLSARDRVIRALGPNWLRTHEASLSRDRAFHELHHVFNTLRSGAEVSVVEVAELSKYLEAFEGDNELPHVLSHLRTAADYRAALFELAMAYRWEIAGASVQLAPLMQTGKRADFSAKIDDVIYTIEVSASPRDLVHPEAASFAKSIERTIKTCKLEDSAVAVELVIEKRVSGDMQGAVQRTLREALKQFASDSKKPLEFALTFGNLKVREASRDVDDRAEGRWNVGQQLVLKQPPADDTLFGAHQEATVGRGPAIYVRLPPDGRDLYSFLLSKYRKERKQLAGTDNRVIILDASSAKSDVLKLDMQRLNESIGEELLRDKKNERTVDSESRMVNISAPNLSRRHNLESRSEPSSARIVWEPSFRYRTAARPTNRERF
ncbi:MAG: hypothetical protein ABSE64_08075 [Vulcanimicrobiaceae bacterium]